MKKIIDAAVWLVQTGGQAYAKKWSFFGLFIFVFIGNVAVLGALDLLPDTASVSAEVVTTATTAVTPPSARTLGPAAAIELPTRIEIPAIDRAATIENPTTTDIQVLDRDLLSGAVRYPTSAKLGEAGNVVLFGHSSYLPVVRDQAYKTFNGIQKLVAGDTVVVYSAAAAYTYRVRTVAKESADANTAIPLSVSGKMLTLVTCNSFATKTDRFVVVADFVESHSLSI